MSQLRTVDEMLRRPPLGRVLLTTLLAIMLLAGCLNEADDATPTPAATGAPVTTTATIPAIAPTATIEPTPTMPPALEGLLDPGPTAPSPQQIIFDNGGDLWTIAIDGSARRLTENMTIVTWTQTVSGSLAAFVQERPNGDLLMHEVRFIAADGSMTGAIFGAVPVSGPDAEPEIVELSWLWGASALAMARSDGSIQALVGLDDPFFDSTFPVTLVPGGDAGEIRDITWGPTGDGVAYIAVNGPGNNTLVVAPRDEEPFDVLDAADGPARTVADFHWLPGRGRIAFVEDSPVPGSRAPASIFTVVPDGSALELLVSASSFAPAATLGGMTASPDGRELAFLLYTPDTSGQPVFDSLWVLHIDSGELREIAIAPGYVATDIWFISGGLLWRGVDTGATGDRATTAYTGTEPFILAFTDTDGETEILFQSTMADEE